MEFSVGSSAGSPAPVASLGLKVPGEVARIFRQLSGLRLDDFDTFPAILWVPRVPGFLLPPPTKKKKHKSGKNYAKRWDYNSLFPIEMILERINLFMGFQIFRPLWCQYAPQLLCRYRPLRKQKTSERGNGYVWLPEGEYISFQILRGPWGPCDCSSSLSNATLLHSSPALQRHWW